MTAPQLAQNTFLLNCIWQSTVCIGLGLAGSYLLRRRPARAHQLLLLGIIAAVAVPVMSTVVRDFGWGLLVARPAGSAPVEHITRFDYDQPEEVAPVESAHTLLSTFEESAAPAELSAREAVEIPWGAILISGWIGASLLLTVRLLVTFLLGIRLLGRAEAVNRTEIQQAVSLAKAKLRFNLPVRILCANKVCTVLIWCWTKRPTLLVPRAIAQAGGKVDWVSVVCHELAHYKRRDHIWGLLAELAVCIFPWNPLLWLAKSRLVRLSEQACDDWVLASGREADGYAESLLDLLPQKLMAFAPAVVSSKNGVAGRIRRILQAKCPNPRTGVLWALAVTIIAASLAVAAAFTQSRPSKKPESPLIKCSGKVVDQYGGALGGAKVTLCKIVSGSIAGNIQLIETGRLVTDSSGTFTFETEAKPEKPTVVWRAVVVAEKHALALGWTNWPLSDDKRVTIELGRPARLAGVVVDNDGNPVAGAQVQAVLFKKATPTQEQTEWLPGIAPLQCLSVKTDNKGRFEFDNIPSGVSADLLLTAPGLATLYTRKPENIKSGYEGAAFKAGKTDIRIIMPPEARIEGKMVERETEASIPHVTLAVVPHFTPTFFERFMCVSKEDGSFSIGGLQSGEYLLRTEPVQGEAPRMNVTVESGQTTSDVVFTLPPGSAYVLARSSPPRTGTILTEPNEIGAMVTFESEIHDFGQVPPGSKNSCEFKFKNTGNAMLSFGKIQTTCGCTVASLKKKHYAPGESGTITTTFSASKRPGQASKRIHVNSNAKTRPKVSLTIKASVVLYVDPEPDKLDLLLNRDNAGCPKITLVSIDGEPFAIKSVTASGSSIAAEFDSSVVATKFVLEPKVDMEKLQRKQQGFVRIAVTHPKCDTVQIPYKMLSRFDISPGTVMVRYAEPDRPVKKEVSIISNYEEDFEIESASSSEGTFRIVKQEKGEHRITLELEITPPPIKDTAAFKDNLIVRMKDGEEFTIKVYGLYKLDKEPRRPTRRR
jgi:beta-lactamase regulating signal transducer with metallopeptidase domain